MQRWPKSWVIVVREADSLWDTETTMKSMEIVTYCVVFCDLALRETKIAFAMDPISVPPFLFKNPKQAGPFLRIFFAVRSDQRKKGDITGQLLCEIENEKSQIENRPFPIWQNRFRSGNKNYLM